MSNWRSAVRLEKSMTTGHSTATSNCSSKRVWRITAAVTATLTSPIAFAGAIGVAGGGIRFGDEIESRLPWKSPGFAGAALASVVGAPTAMAAFTLWRKSHQAAPTTFIAGGLLVGWIVVQIMIIRTFHPLQVVFGLVGIQLAATGWQLARADSLERDASA